MTEELRDSQAPAPAPAAAPEWEDWKTDGASATNPQPGWWEAQHVSRVGRRLVHHYYEGTAMRRTIIDTPDQLVALAGKLGVDDQQLAAGLAVLDHHSLRRRAHRRPHRQ